MDIAPQHFDTLREAENLARQFGKPSLADKLYALGCQLGSGANERYYTIRTEDVGQNSTDDNTIDDTHAVTLGNGGSELELVTVTRLRPGDLIDLAGDQYADAGHYDNEGNPRAEHSCPFGVEYREVCSSPPGELKSPDCFRLNFHDGTQDFPPDHRVYRVIR